MFTSTPVDLQLIRVKEEGGLGDQPQSRETKGKNRITAVWRASHHTHPCAWET